MSASQKDFRVAIVGGGMCGLACAIGLVKAGVHPKFGEVGAGVGIGPNALYALKELGLLEALMSRAEEQPRIRAFRFISGAGAHEFICDVHWPLPLFLEALMPMLDSRHIHFNRRCISISTLPSGPHLLHFADGSTHEADVIIGADGIRSVVREFVTDHRPSQLAYSNSVAYRAVVPLETLQNAGVKTELTRSLCWVGKDQTEKINMVVFSTDSSVPMGSVDVAFPWAHPVPQEELLREYSGWGDDAKVMIKEMKNPSKWYLHFLRPLSSFIRKRVVLVGDAAHAMLPHLGAGVGQGFEDVYVLCRLLGDIRSRKRDLDAALEAYGHARVGRANMVLERSAKAGDIYEGRGAGGATISQTQEQVADLWEPVWHYNLEGVVKNALKSVHGNKGVL
ncbi:hypothetical protein H0H92_005531 [Tricholoma furcatifolium]|nr:hypothetical protein H0H92_005531 [Tricholoma furcatifolium]